jgi:hypothetical protein
LNFGGGTGAAAQEEKRRKEKRAKKNTRKQEKKKDRRRLYLYRKRAALLNIIIPCTCARTLVLPIQLGKARTTLAAATSRPPPILSINCILIRYRNSVLGGLLLWFWYWSSSFFLFLWFVFCFLAPEVFSFGFCSSWES